MFTHSTSFTKEKVFSCDIQPVLWVPKQQPFAKQVGTVLRTGAKIFSQVCLERTSGRRKKNFFFEKLWPNTLSHKNSGGRICVRSREKCWQSTETLKKTSPFVYPSQRKHAKLSGDLVGKIPLQWWIFCMFTFPSMIFFLLVKNFFNYRNPK